MTQRILIPMTALALLAGCTNLGIDQTPRSALSVIQAEVCEQVFQPITFDSLQDTAETIAQIRAHNRAYEAYCREE